MNIYSGVAIIKVTRHTIHKTGTEDIEADRRCAVDTMRSLISIQVLVVNHPQ